MKHLLTSGDHFGEIGCLYGCPRTCSVKTTTFNIIGRLSKPRLRMLLSDHPLFMDKLEKHVYKYKDDNKQLLFNSFQMIEYLKGVEHRVFHAMLYNLQEFVIEQNEIVMRVNDVINSIIIVKSGTLELVMEIDGI